MLFSIWASKISKADLKFLEKYSKRADKLLGFRFQDLTQLSYKQVKHELPKLIHSGRLDAAIKIVFRSKAPAVFLVPLLFVSFKNKLKFVFWIQDQYKILSKLEQKYLVSPPDPKLIAAGVHELDILGDKNLIDLLAGGDVLKWEAVQKLPYGIIFDKQLKNVIDARISKRMQPKALTK